MCASLRDALLEALRDLPGARDLHVHVLTTAPYKETQLYPYATPRPKATARDILVLVSESAPATSEAAPDSAPPRVFVAALQAALYVFPATDAALLYIAKVDTTGQGLAPSPAAPLLRAFVAWHAAPAHARARTLWVQLFARAQPQYLFPDSADYAGKRPLGDARLCAWWRRVLGAACAGLPGARAWLVLPGLGAREADAALGGPDARWAYGHPYAEPGPCGAPRAGVHNLGNVIPSFEDDPKNRFMDELAHADTINERDAEPARKRARVEKERRASGGGKARDGEERAKEKEEAKGPRGELGSVGADEFWERMSFRQECVAGAVTGFFTLVIPVARAPDAPVDSALEPRAGDVPRHVLERVHKLLSTGVDFGSPERAQRATEVVEGALRGLCEGIAAPARNGAGEVAQGEDGAVPQGEGIDASSSQPRNSTPPPDPPAAPAPNGTADSAPTPRTGSADAQPAPAAPGTDSAVYDAHIYGCVRVRNAPPPAKQAAPAEPAPVNVLAVRKKKKKA